MVDGALTGSRERALRCTPAALAPPGARYMRAGSEAVLAHVVNVVGSTRPHHAYLFANRRAKRLVWCEVSAAGRFRST